MPNLAKLSHFAGVIAAQFKAGVFVAFFQAAKRKGQAKRVVIVLPALEGGKVAGEYRRDGFFRAGFADAARHSDHGGMPAPQYGVGVLLKRDARIFDYNCSDACLLKLGALPMRDGSKSARRHQY